MSLDQEFPKRTTTETTPSPERINTSTVSFPERKNKTTEILGTERTDYTGFIQKFRDKKNISYTLKDGRQIFAKFAKYQGDTVRNNLEGMKKEEATLRKLEETGVTPKVLQLKTYPNEKMVRLVTEKLPGTSLDRANIPETKKNEIFQNVITSSAESLQKIHDKGVFVVDINTGTFLVNEEGKDCKVVDMELAIDSSNSNSEEISRGLKFNSQITLLSEALGYIQESTVDGIRNNELYVWGQTMLEFIEKNSGGYRIIESDIDLGSLPPEIRQEYLTQTENIKSRILPEITKKVELELSSQKGQEFIQGAYQRRYDASQSIEDFTENYKKEKIEKELKPLVNRALLGLTLRYKLQALKVNLPNQTLDFLEKCMDVNPNKRPNSFRELIE